MAHFNKAYHKGKFSEYGKLDPYSKRVMNKKWRRTSKYLMDYSEPRSLKSRKKLKKKITVKITTVSYGDYKSSKICKYSSMRDAKNAMNRGNVLRALIVKIEK